MLVLVRYQDDEWASDVRVSEAGGDVRVEVCAQRRVIPQALIDEHKRLFDRESQYCNETWVDAYTRWEQAVAQEGSWEPNPSPLAGSSHVVQREELPSLLMWLRDAGVRVPEWVMVEEQAEPEGYRYDEAAE